LNESEKVLENYTINFQNKSSHSSLSDTFNKESQINQNEKQVTESPWDVRVHRTVKGNHQYRLCILTLAVLKPYRRMKIGTTLVEWVYNRCYALRTNTLRSTDTIAPIPCIPTGTSVSLNYIYLHVWSIDTKAQTFYESLGFVKIDTIQNYYKNLVPPSSIVFVKTIKV
jgi:ribosomal protein S18 acetylase RimI-like enzyme